MAIPADRGIDRERVPTYDYTCQNCGTRFEVRMSIAAYSSEARPPCTACGSERVMRTFTSVNVLTSGRGSCAESGGAPCGRGGFT